MHKTYEIGGKSFVLDEEKAVQAFQEKKVINGRGNNDFQFASFKISVGI